MIRFDHVSQRYPGGFEALHDISFHLRAGEMCFLTGHSGAGKSTLLRLIPRLELASTGQVLIHNQSLARMTRARLPYLRRRIGMVFQSHHLLFDRSVFENVALPLIIDGYAQQDIAKRVRAALGKVGLAGKEKSNPITLSSGQQQRVSIARAVVNLPSIVLADEPTGNLDPQLSMEIMKLFQEFNQVGVTILIASHALDLIRQLGLRTLVLQEGRLIDDLPQRPRRGPA